MQGDNGKVNTPAYGKPEFSGLHMTTRSNSESTLNRNSWLQCSLEVLRDEGIVGVRVERLARDLRVTKGSFYWHFTDRDDLFTSLLAFWTRKYNDVVIKNPRFTDGDPSDGLLAAMIMVREQGLDRFELAMRAWADHDVQADTAVREVYERRKKFIHRFFKRLGFRGLDAEARTRLVLCCLSWEPNMYQEESETRRLSLLKRQHELLTER